MHHREHVRKRESVVADGSVENTNTLTTTLPEKSSKGSSGRKLMPSLFSVLTLSAILFGGTAFSAPQVASAANWDDEIIEEEEELEGMAQYDTTADTVADVVGDRLAVRSITSPHLFDNFESGFAVQWDVLVRPAPDEESHERTYLTLDYDTDFDATISVERCSEPYSSDPNVGISRDGSASRVNACDGDRQSWDQLELEASQYIDGASTTIDVGDFLLQNHAYLRFTVSSYRNDGISPDSNDISLVLNASVDSETVSAGNDGYENVSRSDDNNGDNDDGVDEEEAEEEGIEEEEEEAEANGNDEEGADTTEETPAPEGTDDEDRGDGFVESEETSLIDELLDRPWLFGVLMVVAAAVFFFVRRGRNKSYDDDSIDDEYIDDDDDTEYESDDDDTEGDSIYL